MHHSNRTPGSLMIRRIAVPAALVAALACQAKLFTITIDEEAATTVPKATIVETLLGDFGFGDFVSMNLLDAEELQNQGVKPGDIKDVRLIIFELEAMTPGSDLSFLNSLDIYVEAPGLPEVLIAGHSDFPEGVAFVDFMVEDVDLTEYVVSEALTITTDVDARRPDDDTRVVARFELDVGVTGQGACNQTKKE